MRTVCLSDKAKQKIKDSLDHLIHIYGQYKDKPEVFNNVDRIHGFMSKYNGHRGVRSDIGIYTETLKLSLKTNISKALSLFFKGIV